MRLIKEDIFIFFFIFSYLTNDHEKHYDHQTDIGLHYLHEGNFGAW